MDGSQHTVTKYLNDENIHAVLNIKLFSKLDLLDNVFQQIEVKKPLNVVAFTLHIANLRTLEPYLKYCTVFWT